METLIVAGACACAVLLIVYFALSTSIAQLRRDLERETKSRRADYDRANERGWETSRRVDRLVKALDYEEVNQPCKVTRKAA